MPRRSKRTEWELDFYARVGRRIRERRRACGVGQEMLANLIGISRPVVTGMEWGRQRITADMLWRIARVLEVTPDDLLPRPVAGGLAPRAVPGE